MVEARWEHFPHDADMGVRGSGPTLAEAFEQAGMALTAVVTDPATVGPEVPVEIACEAGDPEDLLFEWLNALIYEMATRRVLFGRFEVRIDGGRLRATAWGEAVRPEKHQLGHVVVADPNYAPMYAQRSRRVKTDTHDALALAKGVCFPHPR
jgi:SHS2 domain-containing protein